MLRTVVCAVALAAAVSAWAGPTATAAPADQYFVSPAARVVSQLVVPSTWIVDVTDYTARSDPDGLLGVPGQYIAKAWFYDSRGTSGIVEVFSTVTDRARREAVLRSRGEYPAATNGRALLRLFNYDTEQYQAYQSAMYNSYVP